MTPADQINTAATLMRERAQAATPGPWVAGAHKSDTRPWADVVRPWEVVLSDSDALPFVELDCTNQGSADAAHIAAADPPTMLEVANWLTMHAGDLKRAAGHIGACPSPADTAAAIAVARAYLHAETS